MTDRYPLSGEQFERVTRYMQDRLEENVTVMKLAAIAGVSKFHFIRLFSATTGSTPYQYMISLRLRAAAQLLSTTGHPVAEIARMCGYASAGQFAAAFRRQFGISPTAFRAGRPDQLRCLTRSEPPSGAA